MAKQQTYDATKMGPLSWRQLQLANQEAYANLDIDDDLRSALQQVTNNMSIPNSGSPEINWEGRVQSPIMRNSNGRDYWGKSMWDEQVADANDFENNLSDIRGQNQPWYAQLGAGLLKGVTTFGTTWLDGTVGLLWGIGAAAGTALFDDNATGWDAAAKIFHNSVSDSLQDFNEFMEEFAPNYKSRDEENNKWYQNMGTMNFWADGLIKNLGFTVGAFYSGSVFTKAIKGIGGLIAAGKAGNAAKAYKAGKIKELMEAGMSAEEAAKAVSPMATAIKYTNALKAIEGARSGTGIAVAGSLFSAVNEGRIEANQVYRDAFTLGNTPEESKGAAAEILAARNRKMQEIEDNPTLLPSEKQALQAQVQANSQKLLAEAEQNAAKAGMLTLGLNIPILTIDNFKMYGRLYSRGFKQSVKQVSNNVTTQELKAAQDAVKNATTKQEKEAAKRALKEAERKAKAAHNARNNARVDDVAENVTDKEGRLAWNEITKGQAAWNGIKSGLMEGNEEMMQAWASGTAGNMTMPEDPDAYYKALTDPNATVKTNDFLTSVTKGFLDSYGNGDRWEEGAIGFLTGILGMPTFGARANSDSNTYLGRGKMIGLSGGFFGEFSNANYLNRLGAESVKNINAFRDKYRQHAQFLAQSQAFTDAMDGYLQDKNEFAYNNARDNDDYAMIQALAVTGRIDEVKAMLNFKDEDLTDDILDSIARDFTENSNLVDSDGNPKTVDDSGKPLQGAWRDKAGNPMSKTKEGKAEMKAKLLEKQKRLNEEIDDYVASLDSVRAQVNNSLDESQVRELAWLDWKNKQWSRRFQDMQGEQAKAFELLISKATDEMKDLKPESDTYKALSNFKELIEKAQKAKSPIELLSALAKNNAFLDAMSKKVGKVAVEQEGGIYQIADEFLGDLITSDEEGLGAIETVGKVLGDIRLMAIAQKQFKEKLDEYTSNPAKLAANRQKIENERQQQQDITQGLNRNNELSNTKLSELLSPDLSDEEFQADFEEFSLVGSKDDMAVYQEAKKIRDLYNVTVNSIRSDSKLSNEQKNAAVALLSKAKSQCTSFDNFKDLSAEAYNNPDNLKDVATGETEEDYNKSLNALLENSQQVLQEHLNAAAKYSDLSPEDIENSSLDRRLDAIPTTGNSEVATTSETENERINREEETKAKEDAEKKREQELRNYIWEEILIINNTPVFDRAVKDKLGDLLVRIALTPEVGIRDSILKGINKYTIIKGAIDSDLFKEFMSIVSANDKSENGSITEYFNKVAISKLYIEVDNLYNPKTIAEKEAEEKKKQQSTKNKEEYERENPITITISEEEASKTDENVVDREPVEGEYKYWKPTTSEFGFGRKGYQKANYTKFYERAKNMGYSKQQLKRIEEVGKYFEEHDVWNRVNLGQINLGQVDNKKNVVQFVIDPKLNKAAGEIVILMTDKNGNVIGDVMSKNDPRLKSQDNLTGFVDWVEEEYKEFEKEHPNEKFIPTLNGNPVSTHISKWMIGKVPYSEQFITLNEAVGTDSSKFKLGIAVRNPNSGKIEVKASAWKVGSLKPIDLAIIQPLEMQAGQPFLLVRSEGRGAYMCVPIVTPLYDRANKDTIDESPYGGVIKGAIADIQKILNDEKTDKTKAIYRIKDILANVFATDTFYVSYNPSTKKWSFKVLGSQFYETTNTDFSVDVFLNSIVDKNLGLQISRNFINGNKSRTDDNGKRVNFNRVLGSIAKVNITSISTLTGNPEAYLHTIDDWFVTNMLKVEKDSSGNIKITEIKATAPKSTETNPNAAPKQSTTVTIGKKVYEVDLNHHKVNSINVRTTKDKELKVAYAVAWCRATNKKGIVKVPDLGEFNTKTNQFTGSAQVKQASNNSAKSLWEAANTNSFESEFEESTPTTTTQTTTEQQSNTDLANMSQNEYAEWLKVNGKPNGAESATFYDLLTARSRYRGENFNDRMKYYQDNIEALKALTAFLQEICSKFLNGTISVDGVKASSKGTGWNHFIINNNTKHSTETNKGYITLTQDSVLSLTENDIVDFLKAVQESGFNGQVKFPEIGSRMILAFDNFVIHGQTKEDVGKAMAVAEKFWGSKIEATQRGVDKNGTSHTDVLAKEVEEAIKNGKQPTAQQASEQQSTTPQVSEQAPSTEITQEEREEITKNNQVQLPSSKYPSGNKNIGGYLAQISSNDGGSWGRVADTDDGSSSYYRMFDVNGDTAKFEFYAPGREQKGISKWSSVLDSVADYDGNRKTADTVFTVEAGEVKRNSNGRWIVAKKAKLQLVKKEDIANNVYTDTEAVKRDIDSLQRSKNWKRQAWENQKREQEQQEVEQKPIENPVQLPTAQEVLDNKGAEYLDKGAEDSGLFEVNKNKGKKVWDSLTDEQKNIILSATNPKSIVDQLSRKLKNGKFPKAVDIDAIINNAKYSRVTEEEREVWDREKELAWLKKALPQLSNEQRVQIVDGLIKIKNSDNPGYAWGQFCRGIITISNEAASGTLYHEAFHAVIDLLMTEDEYNKLFDAAYQIWGNLGMLGLEEKLAEEFRKFVQYGDNAAFVDYDAEDIKTPIIRGIVRLFRRLKALIQGLSNKQIYLNKLFYDINKGKFADRKVQEGRNLQPKFDINERELEDIKKKAIANGTFMKAPNGKPTNLNERQWLQVRTKAFKDWFGDWENDPANASKVVDENGEPLVVYHGSDYANDSTKQGDWSNNALPYATYFAPHKYGKAKYYYSAFLNIKNPLASDLMLTQEAIQSEDIFEREIVNKGYDGAISTGVDLDEVSTDATRAKEIVVISPNQIKSATDNVGTFSRENNDIRYSRVKTELDNKVAEFAEAINKSIAETMTLNRYAQNWDYTKNIPLRRPDASNNDGRKAYFGIKNPMHFYKGQWTISNGAAKYGGKDYHDVVKNEVFRRLAMVGMLDKFNALFDVTWNDATNHYVINLKAPEKIATLSEIVDFDSIPDDVLADMIAEKEKQAKEYSKNRENEILDGATKHTTILFEGKTKIGLGKLFENMISAGVNRNKVALYRNILDRLGELKDIEVEISDNKDSRFSGGKVAGWYFSSSNNIALLNNLDDSFLEDSIVHEALHTVVANTVKDKEKSDKVVVIVEGIKKAVLEEYGVKSIDAIQDSGTRRLFYGLTNADEFISEFFSNSEFHDYVKNKQATWYNRFIDFIKSILGLDVDITKVVKDLLSDFNGQIQEVRQTISMQNQLGTIFRDIADLSKQAVRPQENTEKQEPSIKQYHIQNLMYENLSEEDKEYIKEKGLSKEEYDNFSMTEKENLWYCR